MRASVVIRARDEAASIGRLLDLLSEQTAPHEVLVIDSGSRDDTVRIARGRGVEVVEIPPERFSFGGALNLGASRVSSEVVVSLSAHAFPCTSSWLEGMAAWLDDATVACVFGDARDATGQPLTRAVRQDAAQLRAHPEWGYSNGAGAFRRSLWEKRPFREDMPGTEDREWSLWALEQGLACVIDPALVVDHDHAHDSLAASYRRYEREARGYSMFLDLPPYGVTDAVREWWTDHGWYRSAARARLDPRRVARLAGKWKGRRG